MKKVALFLAPSDRFGGAERRLLHIFGRLSENPNIESRAIIKGINLTEAGVKKIQSFWGSSDYLIISDSQLYVIKEVLNGKYDWICGYDFTKRSILMYTIAKIVGTKILFCSVNNSCSLLQFNSSYSKVLYHIACRMADKIDCLYPLGAEVIKKKYPYKQITTTPGSFVNYEKYTISKRKEKIIVFLSRLVKEKNPIMFLEAVKLAKNEIVSMNYHVMICGDGALSNDVDSYIEKNDLENICTRKGFVDSSIVFPEARIYCSLQSFTNYPSQSLIEAAACGCYCIVSDTGESDRMITDQFGSLVAMNPISIAESIVSAMNFPEDKWETISYYARNHMLKMHNEDASINYFEKMMG